MPIQTSNMGLYQPLIGIDSGLIWENSMNSNATLLDQHNHGAGSGVQIDPSGISINTDLPFNSNNATLLRSARFTAQVSPLALGTDIGCIYVSGLDLYYNDISGNQIRITAGGLVNATSSGISSGTASASFVSSVLVVNSAAATPASIQGGSIIVGNSGVSGSNFVTVSPPSALAANYALTLPVVSPSGTQLLVIDSSGNMAPNAGTVSATVANNIGSAMTSTGANAIAATMTLTGVNLIIATSSNADFPGTSVKEGGQNVVVSSTNAVNSLCIIRGAINSIGQVLFGEGFNSARNSTGNYTINWTQAFGDTPAITTTCSSDACLIQIAAVSSTSAQLQVVTPGGLATDQTFHFIAIGQRA